MDRRCQECGGPFPLSPENTRDTPQIIYYLNSSADEEILNTSCAELGLPSLAFLEAAVLDHRTQLFQLAGSLDHLYELGENNGQH
jgi:hypothetical protein